jgi:hypothetical protein
MERDEYMAKWHPEARRGMDLVYGWDGQPLPRDEWLKVFAGDRRVGYARTTRGAVSTVFMGIDMGYGMLDGSVPILFETMVFGGPLDSSIGRYATLQEARAGHAEWVRLLRGRLRRPLIHNGKKSRLAKKKSSRV